MMEPPFQRLIISLAAYHDHGMMISSAVCCLLFYLNITVANSVEPDQTAPLLIWVHTVQNKSLAKAFTCRRRFQQTTF